MIERGTQLIAGSLAAFVYFAEQAAPGEITSGRARALVGAAAGLISVITGAIALARSAGYLGTGNGRLAAILALVAGLIGIVLSVFHLAAGTSGFGTGGGRLGAIVGIVLALIGIALGGFTYVRSGRSPNTE